MDRRLSISEWITAFLNGEFESNDVHTQIKAQWFDWFCKDSSLANKTIKMGNIIKDINSGGKVNLKGWYPWFKNNCPLNGPLYDDFRFADIETGDVMFTIQIDCCWNEHKYSVYGRTPDGVGHWEEPLFETDSVKELKKWLNSPWEVTTVKVGDKIKIINMKDEPQYTGKEGVVEFIDDEGQIHGTWGGCALNPKIDEYQILN